MQITVILCTYNRCQSLARALSSVAASRLAQSVEWGVLVVDNNSRDHTRDVVDKFCHWYPGRFRYLFEPQQGKSFALNAGIRAAGGNILVFTDDDVTVEPTWLQNLTAALHNSEWAGAGGRVLPEWTCPPPSWLSLDAGYLLAPLAHFDLGPEAGQLQRAPFGTNMAFRKSMFEKYGGFRTDLGPTTESDFRLWNHTLPPRTSEDSEFAERLLAAGERLRYEPSAVVHHPVAENRLQMKYFLAWWFQKGRGDIRQSGVRPDTKLYLLGIPLYLIRDLAVLTLRWMVAVQPRRRFQHKITMWYTLGQISESYRRTAQRRGMKETL